MSTPSTNTDATVFSCRECGACCRGAIDGRVLVYEEDLVLWKRVGRQDIIDGLVPGHFSQDAFPSTPEGACIYLGVPGHPNDCSIYEIRGWSCHALEPGSGQCRTYRKERGFIDPPAS